MRLGKGLAQRNPYLAHFSSKFFFLLVQLVISNCRLTHSANNRVVRTGLGKGLALRNPYFFVIEVISSGMASDFQLLSCKFCTQYVSQNIDYMGSQNMGEIKRCFPVKLGGAADKSLMVSFLFSSH